MTVPVMYLGERTDWRGQVRQLFRDKKGEDLYWAGRKRVFFGEVYESTKKGRGKNADHVMERKPKQVDVEGWEPTEAERTEYEAAKVAVLALRQERQKAFKFKRPAKQLVNAVNLVRPYYLTLSNLDRRRLMEWFANECSKKKRK